MGFVPKDPSILTSIGLVQPGKKASVEFTVPKELGDYPYVCTFPGHSLTMRGVMKVSEDPDKAIAQVNKIVAENTTPRNGILEVGNEPRVVRVHVKDVDSGRSIAVGLPGYRTPRILARPGAGGTRPFESGAYLGFGDEGRGIQR